jgi:hypothetical protein
MNRIADSWETLFNELAAFLLRDFGSRIRGFRQAKRQSIVRSFIAKPGRIRIERERITVVPDPSPFHVALRISGFDEPADAPWMGGRRIEFVLADL